MARIVEESYLKDLCTWIINSESVYEIDISRTLAEIKEDLENMPEVVRCKDCNKGRPIDKTKCPEKYFKESCVVCLCEQVVGDEPMIYEPTHFCSYGERRADV